MKQVDRRAVWSWALYDFANSAFTTIVVTFIYATFFTKVIAADEIRGTAQWSLAVTATALTVALLSPILGAIADRGGHRKGFLFGFTVVCIVASVGLYFPTAGQVLPALLLFLVGNIAFEMACVFYNAFLPDVAPAPYIGRVSGLGWGLGYIGGLLAMLLGLVFLVNDHPWLFSTAGGSNVRATNLLVAAWYALGSIPIFLWVREDRSRSVAGGGPAVRAALRQLVETFHEVRRYRQVVRFLIARLFYNDGLITIFAFGGIYAAGTFHFDFREIMVFGIVLNLTAGIGSLVFGFLDDRLGGRNTILVSLVGLSAGALLAVGAPADVHAFTILGRSFELHAPLFWLGGILVGIFAGPNQSSSRSLLGRFVPPDRENEFFGFFALSGKMTAFMGPFLLGRLTEAFGSQRAGVSVVVVFFIVGGVILFALDERAGVAAAGRS